MSIVLLVWMIVAMPLQAGFAQPMPAEDMPPRGPDGRVVLGDMEGRIARGRAALVELANVYRQAEQGGEMSLEERGWAEVYLLGSLSLGNIEDGQLIADRLTDAQANPYERAAAANAALFTLDALYSPDAAEMDDPDTVEMDNEPTPAKVREVFKPFWDAVTARPEQLLEAARDLEAAEDDAKVNELPQSQRTKLLNALLLSALDGGDEKVASNVLETAAGVGGETYGRVIAFAAAHEPPRLPAEAKALQPTLDRLLAELEKGGAYSALADAAAEIGPPAASLADDLVRIPNDSKVVAEKGHYNLDVSAECAFERFGPAATPYLLPLLEHEDPHIRGRTIAALSNIYATSPTFREEAPPAPQEVVAAVRSLTDDEVKLVRDLAQDAIYWWSQ